MNTDSHSCRWSPVEGYPGQPYTFGDKLSSHFRTGYSKPAVYRWKVFLQDGNSARELYIGETANLYRRTSQYLNPGPTQFSNIRMNSLFTDYGQQNQRATLEYLDFETLRLVNVVIKQDDLKNKYVRRALENLLVYYYQSNQYVVHNL